MAESFFIATFNTLNLLHPDVFFACRPNDKAYPPDVYSDKIEWIVRTLKDGDVGLAGLQELFSAQALNEVAARRRSMKLPRALRFPTSMLRTLKMTGISLRIRMAGKKQLARLWD